LTGAPVNVIVYLMKTTMTRVAVQAAKVAELEARIGAYIDRGDQFGVEMVRVLAMTLANEKSRLEEMGG